MAWPFKANTLAVPDTDFSPTMSLGSRSEFSEGGTTQGVSENAWRHFCGFHNEWSREVVTRDAGGPLTTLEYG